MKSSEEKKIIFDALPQFGYPDWIDLAEIGEDLDGVGGDRRQSVCGHIVGGVFVSCDYDDGQPRPDIVGGQKVRAFWN